MIDAQAGVASEIISEVIPESVDALVRMKLAQGVGPALSDQVGKGLSRFGTKERVFHPAFGLVNIDLGRDHVVVAGENGGRVGSEENLRVFRQALEPTELVVELGPRRGIAVGQIKAADDDAVDTRLDVAAVRVLGIAGQAATTLDRFAAAREDRDAIPAFLAMPDWRVAGFADRRFRKFFLRRLQFLEARDIRFEFGQPAQERRKPSADAVDVEGCDLHWTISPRTEWRRTQFCAKRSPRQITGFVYSDELGERSAKLSASPENSSRRILAGSNALASCASRCWSITAGSSEVPSSLKCLPNDAQSCLRSWSRCSSGAK